jgi:hypothetical protein
MRGVYVLRDTITAVTTAKELLYIQVPSDSVVEILSARVTCQDEDTSEQMFVTLARATGTQAGGDSLTPEPLETGSVASGCTCKGGNTAITGLTQQGDSQAIASHGANKLAGWQYLPLPEERHILSPSTQLTLELIDDLANSSDLSCEIVYREIGG